MSGKEVGVVREGGSSIYGSQVPYVLGTKEETDAVLAGKRDFTVHVSNQWGDISNQPSFRPLLTGARLVYSRAHFMSMEGVAPEEVRAYIADNFMIIAQLESMGIADERDVTNALSYLENCLSRWHDSPARKIEKPHVHLDIRFKEGPDCELYGISVHAPAGYSFNPLTAAAVLHEAIGASAGITLSNEFRYAPRRNPLPFTVLQYEPACGERKYTGKLRLRITEKTVETRKQSARSPILVPGATIDSLASGIQRLDDILQAA